ncbi:MAG: hypothetical protein FVQ81_05020 [Candidatus Glassbacteria bacterium]|nr:hypothetical protein [Candidatus Glassbacteria bacterium]
MFEGSVIIWLVLAIVTAFLAAKKNRSFLGWLIIGLIIPLIGFILILVMPKGKALENAAQSA